jgi:hypothetical protein
MTIQKKLQALGAAFASHAPDALMIGGAGGVAYGAGLVYFPAGYIVAGLFALLAGLLLARGRT